MADNIDVDVYEVMLDAEATTEEVAAIRAAFGELGLPVRVEANYERKGVGDFPWVIDIAIPIGSFLLGLAGKPAVKFGERIADTLGDIADDWLKNLYRARKRREGAVVIRQTQGAPEVLLDRELPAEAWDQLKDLHERNAYSEIPGECYQIRYENGEWRRPW